MPSGDAQRAWFPEMLMELDQFWSPDVSWDALIIFCARMTSFRAEIREANGIRPPMIYCRSCGGKHAADLPGISPRSALFALQKRGIISDVEMKKLDRNWTKYRKERHLDAYGNPKATGASATNDCPSKESTTDSPMVEFPETQ